MRNRTFKNEDGTVTKHPPVLKTKHAAARSVRKCDCTGCALGKLNHCPTKSSIFKNKSEMGLKVNKVAPGDKVFAD